MAHRTTAQASNNIPQRPTTPLRTPSRTSFRASHSYTPGGTTTTYASNSVLSSPLTSLEPAFGELSDALADLEANMTLLQQQHESIARFTENFAAFLYGLDMNAYCVDWVEAPGREAWARVNRRKKETQLSQRLENARLAEEKDDAQATPRAVRGGRDARDRTPRKFTNGGANADVSMLSTTSARTTTSTATSSTNTSSNIGRGRASTRRSGIARGRVLAPRNGSRIASTSSSTAGATSVSGFGYGSRPASVVSSGTAASARENGSTAGLRGRGVARGSKVRGRGGFDGTTGTSMGRGRGRGGSNG